MGRGNSREGGGGGGGGGADGRVPDLVFRRVLRPRPGLSAELAEQVLRRAARKLDYRRVRWG